jgi:transcriptional regulator
MYNPASFRTEDRDEMAAIMRAARLPILVSATDAGLEATHLPLCYAPEPGPYGRLVGHMARANKHWHALRDGAATMVIFQADDFYVSPSWYATKRETGRVVPTWNYQAVHAAGSITVIDDPARLHDIVASLTDHHEAQRAAPWHVDDAPADYIAAQLKAIVGIELTITSLIGKRKLSQNRPLADRHGVIAGLHAAGEAGAAALMQALEDEGAGSVDRSGLAPSLPPDR